MIIINNMREGKMLRCILHDVRQAMEAEGSVAELLAMLPRSTQGASLAAAPRVERET